MKLISIGTGQNVFGAESSARRRFIEYGDVFDEVHMIVFSPAEKNEQNQKLSNNVFLYPTNTRIRPLFILDYLKIVKKIIGENGKEDLVISVQDPFETGVVGLLAKLRYRLPLQVQIHTDFHNKYFILHSPLNFIRFFLAQIVLSFADSVRAVSARVAKSVGSLCENVDILPIFTEVTDERFQVTAREKSKVKFLTAARLEKEKDLGTLIKAFAKVVKSNPETELVIVGDGSERENLENLVSRYPSLETRVSFVGWQNNTSLYFDQADAYISSSLYEGYGMSVVEAAKRGLPLVLSETGVAGEIFKGGESAFVCKQKDAGAFAAAMQKLASDAELRRKMGESAERAAKITEMGLEEYKRRYAEAMSKAVQYSKFGHGIFRRNILLRYLTAGITAASSNILLFYIFTYPLGIWYLYSSVFAYLLSFLLSFVLQKFWTFRDKSFDRAHYQFLKYGLVALIGVAVNAACMFVFVDVAGIWPMVAQILTGAIIAVFNFFAYKAFIFK